MHILAIFQLFLEIETKCMKIEKGTEKAPMHIRPTTKSTIFKFRLFSKRF